MYTNNNMGNTLSHKLHKCCGKHQTDKCIKYIDKIYKSDTYSTKKKQILISICFGECVHFHMVKATNYIVCNNIDIIDNITLSRVFTDLCKGYHKEWKLVMINFVCNISQEALNLIANNPRDKNILTYACKKDKGLARRIFNRANYLKVDLISKNHETLLMDSIRVGADGIALEILNKFGNSMTSNIYSSGYTPLMLACGYNLEELALKLLEYPDLSMCNVSVKVRPYYYTKRRYKKTSALFIACENHMQKVIMKYIDLGYTKNIPILDNNTFVEVVKLIKNDDILMSFLINQQKTYYVEKLLDKKQFGENIKKIKNHIIDYEFASDI